MVWQANSNKILKASNVLLKKRSTFRKYFSQVKFQKYESRQTSRDISRGQNGDLDFVRMAWKF